MKIFLMIWMLSGVFSFFLILVTLIKREGMESFKDGIKNNDLKPIGLLIKFIFFGPMCLYLVYEMNKR